MSTIPFAKMPLTKCGKCVTGYYVCTVRIAQDNQKATEEYSFECPTCGNNHPHLKVILKHKEYEKSGQRKNRGYNYSR